RYQWGVNGNVVRTSLNAALSDAIPKGAAAVGDVVICSVTPTTDRRMVLWQARASSAARNRLTLCVEWSTKVNSIVAVALTTPKSRAAMGKSFTHLAGAHAANHSNRRVRRAVFARIARLQPCSGSGTRTIEQSIGCEYEDPTMECM